MLSYINLYDLIFHERSQALKVQLNKNLLNYEKEKSKQVKEKGRKKWEFRLGLGRMANATWNTHLNMGFLRFASSRTTRSTDPLLTLTSVVTLKSSSTPLSWLLMVYMTVMLDVAVGTGLG